MSTERQKENAANFTRDLIVREQTKRGRSSEDAHREAGERLRKIDRENRERGK